MQNRLKKKSKIFMEGGIKLYGKTLRNPLPKVKTTYVRDKVAVFYMAFSCDIYTLPTTRLTW